MLKTYYLIWRWSNGDTKLQAIINFMNEQKHEDFEKASNKRHWLRTELNLPDDYFWNTYLEDPEVYIEEKDNEYLLEKEIEQADEFDIK